MGRLKFTSCRRETLAMKDSESERLGGKRIVGGRKWLSKGRGTKSLAQKREKYKTCIQLSVLRL